MSDAAMETRPVEEVDMQAYSLQVQAPGAMLGSNDPSCIARKILQTACRLAGDLKNPLQLAL